LAVALISGALVGCGGGGGRDDSDAMGTLTISVTDAPVDDVAEVWVQFTGVRVKPAGGDALEFTFNAPVNLDLLTLTGETSATLLNGQAVPAGRYEWIALNVNARFDNVFDSYVVPMTGGMIELQVPSGDQQGLRLVSGFTVTQNQNSSFVIDWDLRKGLTDPTGQPGMFLRPALRIVDMTEYGSIVGTVADGLVMDADCQNDLAENRGNLVYVYEGADVAPVDIDGVDPDPLTTATVAPDDQAAGAYAYEATFLSPGDYTVAFTCQGLGDDPTLSDVIEFIGTQNVVVVDGQEATADFE
jgi:hypothetical protein